jgi:hypothetical protein
MVLCPKCGVLLKENNSICWNCRCKVDAVGESEGNDNITMQDWFATFLMMAVPLLAYYIVYLKGL